MARPARPEQTKSARSSRQLSRFCYLINPDKVFGTHTHLRQVLKSYAVLAATGYNFRRLIRWLRLLWRQILAALFPEAFDQSGLRQGFFTDDSFTRDPRRPSSPLRSSLSFRYTHPLCPPELTSSARKVKSEKCHFQTLAPQRNLTQSPHAWHQATTGKGRCRFLGLLFAVLPDDHSIRLDQEYPLVGCCTG